MQKMKPTFVQNYVKFTVVALHFEPVEINVAFAC